MKPYLLTSRISAEAVPTIACVRSPALFPRNWRSNPMIEDRRERQQQLADLA